MNILVLGCGPAGLMAAHAASMLKHDVLILSKARKSYMRGAQYLHRPIPMASGEPFQVEYRLIGSVEGYRDKVYGSGSRVEVSPETLVGTHDAWDIREAYDWLWETYGQFVQEFDIERGLPAGVNAHHIISTVPREKICRDPEHSFSGTRVWATEQANHIEGDNVVVCSGEKDHAWYRQSSIHGWNNTEYPDQRRPPMSTGIHAVIKPTTHNCTCRPDIHYMGRYGAWKKGVLAHESFYDTYELLKEKEDA